MSLWLFLVFFDGQAKQENKKATRKRTKLRVRVEEGRKLNKNLHVDNNVDSRIKRGPPSYDVCKISEQTLNF